MNFRNAKRVLSLVFFVVALVPPVYCVQPSTEQLTHYSQRLRTKDSREIAQLTTEIKDKKFQHPLFINALHQYLSIPDLSCADLVAETLITLDDKKGYEYAQAKIATGSDADLAPVIRGIAMISAGSATRAYPLIEPYVSHASPIIRAYAVIAAARLGRPVPLSVVETLLPILPESSQTHLLVGLSPFFEHYKEFYTKLMTESPAIALLVVQRFANDNNTQGIAMAEQILPATQDSYLRLLIELVLYEHNKRPFSYTPSWYAALPEAERYQLLLHINTASSTYSIARSELLHQLSLTEQSDILKKMILSFDYRHKEPNA